MTTFRIQNVQVTTAVNIQGFIKLNDEHPLSYFPCRINLCYYNI